jgi:hypothetical protein
MTDRARFRDRYGLPLSTPSPAAVEHYSEGIDRTLSGNAGSEHCLEQAVTLDEGFALAQIALARSEQFRGLIPQARERAARARQLAAGTTPREESHVRAIATAIEQGGGPEALAAVKEHAGLFPRDAFVLSQASGVYGLIGFSGRQDRNVEQLALLESVADAYGEEDWWFLSALGFAHNELYHFAEARRLVDRSLEIYDRNAHAAHAMGHVLFETGDSGGGIAFLDPWIEGYDRSAQLYGHLSWHLALFELAADNVERALQLHEQNISPRASKLAPLGVLADSASLLWRCELYGAGAQSSWDEVRELAARSFPRSGVTFADVHAGLAYAASGDQESLDRLLGELRERAATGKLAAGEAVIELVEGVAAFADGDFEKAVRLLDPIAGQVIRIGGSHAQREVFEDTLLEAYLRTGRNEQATNLLRERLERRPSPRDVRWLERAQVSSTTAAPTR